MKKLCCMLIVMVLLLCCAGCDTYETFNYYPWHKSTHWYCEEIDYEFVYTENEYGNLETALTPLELNGETYMVYGVVMAGYFELVVDNGDGIYTIEERIVGGPWSYRGDTFVVEITMDTVFDGAFEELVFVPRS